MKGITMKSPSLFALLLVAACTTPANAPERAAPRPLPAAPEKSASAKIAKIAFIDQAEACECTTKRIAASWSALEAALAKSPPGIPVERIHLDRDEAKADKYDEMESLIVPPGIYFFDENEALVEMLQGEITVEQISEVLR